MRRSGFAIVVVLVVVLAGWLVGARRTAGAPFDPRSTEPTGARALVELVDAFATIEVIDTVPGPDVDAAILLVDRFDRAEARALRGWVAAGGTLVVAGPGSPLVPPMSGGRPGLVEVSCTGVSFGGIGQLDLGRGSTFGPVQGEGCRTADGASVVEVDVTGEGRIVTVSSRELFTNDRLDEADNAVLAVSLLAPTPGTRSAFLQPAVVAGTGDATLVDLVSTPVRAALAQLVVAFAAVVLWRVRRHGAPVLEPQPVAVESAEFTAAVGRMLERNRHPERAAAILRDRARRDLSGPLGLALDAPVDVVVSALAARTSLDDTEIQRAVAAPVLGDDDLVLVAAALVRIREEITHGRSIH